MWFALLLSACGAVDGPPDGKDAACVDADWFLDGDHDGFGDSETGIRGCGAPLGYVSDPTDCDDSAVAVHPDAQETCDGADQDCDGAVDEDATDATEWFPDADLDGYGTLAGVLSCAAPDGAVAVSGDCADEDAEVHPEAEERCDGVDQDCDGVVDEDAPGESNWYPDADGDGFGDGSVQVFACAAPEGHVPDATDCDDTRADIHPGAGEPDCTDGVDHDCDGAGPGDDVDADGWVACEDCDDHAPEVSPTAAEFCNGWDDDCDGTVDEDDAIDAPIWHVDDDNDGYGSSDGGTAVACSPPAGFGAAPDDCDDAEPTTNPGAAEVCGDGVDNDCSGDDWGCGPVGEMALAGADAIYEAESSGDLAGWDVAAGGDLDGDGAPDLLITAVNERSAGVAGGAVYIIFASDAGSRTLGTAGAKVTAESDNSRIGVAKGVGDTDGDGYDDFMTSGYMWDSYRGVAYLVHGPVSGTTDLSTAAARLEGEFVLDKAGSNVGGGDFDGDGDQDLFVSASDSDLGGRAAGAVYVFTEPVSGLGSVGDAQARIIGEEAEDYLGSHDGVASPGDVDGDGVDDLLMGAYGQDGEAGAVYLFHGPFEGDIDASEADAVLRGEAPADFAGINVAVPGDMDGDGVPDLLLGGGHSVGGIAYLVYSPVSGAMSLADADNRLLAVGSEDAASYGLAGAGDVDADGNPDIGVGAWYPGTSLTSAGCVYVLLGPIVGGTSSLADSDATLQGETVGDGAGQNVAGVGDVDLDGYDDLLLGADQNLRDYWEDHDGKAYLVRGGIGD